MPWPDALQMVGLLGLCVSLTYKLLTRVFAAYMLTPRGPGPRPLPGMMAIFLSQGLERVCNARRGFRRLSYYPTLPCGLVLAYDLGFAVCSNDGLWKLNVLVEDL